MIRVSNDEVNPELLRDGGADSRVPAAAHVAAEESVNHPRARANGYTIRGSRYNCRMAAVDLAIGCHCGRATIVRTASFKAAPPENGFIRKA